MRSCRTTSAGCSAVLVVLLAVLAAGCQARLRLDVAVDREGAGTIAVALGADAELLAQAAAAGADPLGDLAAAGAALRDEGWRTSVEHDGEGGRTVALAAAFDSPEELARLADELAEGLSGPELTPLEELRLHLDPDEVRLEGVVGLVPDPPITDLGLQPDQAVELLRDTDALVYEVTADLPGEVLRANATAGGEGEPLRWRVPPGERVALLAVSERPPDPRWLLAAAGAAGALVVLVVLAVAVRRRRRARGATRERRLSGAG